MPMLDMDVLTLEATMSTTVSSDISNLMTVRRLLEMEEDAKARRSGKKVEEKSALDYMEEDQALISSSAVDAQKQSALSQPQIENINVNLADLQSAVKQAADLPRNNQAIAGVVAQESLSVEIEMELRYQSNAPIDGLIVHDKNYAESDRYLFKFADGATFTILDKWTSKSTTIWGDPHVDVDDVEGTSDGDFKDLKSSEDVTTFMLGDGTRVTFKAKDAGIIEQVDIFKGSQHVIGIGQAAKDFSPENGLFSTTVLKDGASSASATPLGDVVSAGGDGNDWFDVNNKLIWGKTTGPVVTNRPPATLEFFYKQTVSQSVSIQTLARDA
jgi:hypothetical protein